MITLIQINQAVNSRIEEALTGSEFSTVEIVAEDLEEPIIRPSIKVAIEDGTNGKYNSACREKTLTCRVYFFAKDRHKFKLDNLKMRDLLENAFLDDLQVMEGFYIPIENVTSEVSDTILICSFDLYTIELLPDTDTSEPMETLNINLRKED